MIWSESGPGWRGLGIWGAVALGGVGMWIACRRRGIALYVAGYTAGRFWIEGLRADPANEISASCGAGGRRR
ncbi:hypothetical protein HS041_28630 [Planomonospora sp. ID67723]|uniref:hypothetical protein n=1 Tax=Planomonospora sp. ID67723 TaxID=2738134 RepID=UPI0018C3FB63|nr:hypothetical protein [Planomonospora sp. ID67723]MBG0831698.1 hypothetical protein [Planomonospora sp. ID67723]